MRKPLFFCLTCCLLYATPAVRAQPYAPGGPGGAAGYNPNPRPVLSPYLNLLRPGVSPAVNYYGLVRPQQGFMNQFGQLQQQVQSNAAGMTDQNTMAMQALAQLLTGHKTGFMTQSKYFMNNGAGPVSGGFGGARSPALMNTAGMPRTSGMMRPPTAGMTPGSGMMPGSGLRPGSGAIPGH